MATSIGEIGSREVIFATRDMTAGTAAKFMRHHHVGGLVVVEQLNGGKRLPVGIVTIDDLVKALADQMTELAKVVAREQSRESATRR